MWALVFPRYIVSDAQAEFLGRGRGPFLNPVGNGMFLCAGLFSLLMFWPRVRRYGKVSVLLLTLVYLAGIYCTLTRVVWLAAAGGLLAMRGPESASSLGGYLRGRDRLSSASAAGRRSGTTRTRSSAIAT